MTHAAKCPHCDGWGFEPGVTPLEACTVCEGSGRPPQTKELIDG